MRKKILTIDDSKTVRIIVRKAFRAFDCDIIEAANGVEGLAVASKEMPDLVLLDVTMPVMDGVETLTKLKSDPQLKSIPVMMLTAEGGREQVLKIAKIGVRDYIVKPFKEDVLVEKANRIVDLKPLADGPSKVRSILDPADVLIVDDKPAIVRQVPDLIIISLALPDDAAYALFRNIRAAAKTKYTPVFALVVKTEVNVQQAAQQAGFSYIITKPIDLAELESRMARAMNLDTSQRYYSIEEDLLVMRLPENCSPAVLAEAGQYLQTKLADAVDSGYNKAVIDIHPVKSLHMGVIKLLMHSMQACRELALQFALVANARIVAECKGFEDTRSWTFYETLEEAKANLGKSSPGKQPAPQPVAAGT
jgi:two-component system cell cycle response regulator